MIVQELGRALAPAAVIAISLTSGAFAEGGESSLVPREEVAAYAIVEEPAPAEAAAPAAVEEAAPAAAAAKPRTGRARASKAEEGARAEALRALVERHAEENGVPFALAHAVVRVESGYNAGARNGPHLGLTQISASTAKALGYQGAAAGLLDPDTNLRYGLKYLAQAYQLARGDTCGAIQRYRGGHRSVTISRTTRTYCAKVRTITASAQ